MTNEKTPVGIADLLIAKINQGREDQRVAAEKLARIEAAKLETALMAVQEATTVVLNGIDTNELLKVLDDKRAIVGGTQSMTVRDDDFGTYAKAREIIEQKTNEELEQAKAGVFVEIKLGNGRLVLDVKKVKEDEGEKT